MFRQYGTTFEGKWKICCRDMTEQEAKMSLR